MHTVKVQDPGEPIREDLIQFGYAIRKGDWKLIFDLEEWDDVSESSLFEEELYNLKDDPAKSENLISQHPEKVDELISAFIESWKEGI